jgi:hypothetical protein
MESYWGTLKTKSYASQRYSPRINPMAVVIFILIALAWLAVASTLGKRPYECQLWKTGDRLLLAGKRLFGFHP